ncbi:hypothetical protein POM88_017761 [Heracleum sosnowskyi]|uniref:Uncharacterized protein n=1 Tax=Heracleum sosnowskyi TaxID=360622 RepID=A0AAD8MZQ1_9APIA|nr:hypothetical protein POM88_017761 [Heracleum sosnowskyi]
MPRGDLHTLLVVIASSALFLSLSAAQLHPQIHWKWPKRFRTTTPTCPPMVSMNKGINNIQGIRDTGDGQCVVMLPTEFEKIFEKVELTMLRGVKDWFKGLVLAIALKSYGNAAMFGAYEGLKQYIAGGQDPLIGEVFWIYIYPTDVVKSAVQVDDYKNSKYHDILASEGVEGL